MNRFYSCVLLFVTLFWFVPFSHGQERRLALIMGVGDYKGTQFHTLPGIDKDLQKMESALKATGFEVTVVENPTLTGAEDAIDTFGAKLIAQKDAVGLFYFSGHGGEFEGRNYLIPKGARIYDLRDIKEQAIAAQRVLNRMAAAGTRVNIVFLDCCRNDMTKAATDTGLAPMGAKGTFIGFATATDKTSAASSQGSPYTTFLAKRLLSPGISILDMHTQVTADVEDYAKDHRLPEQTPFQYSGLRSSFFFVPSSRRFELVPPERPEHPPIELPKLSGIWYGAAVEKEDTGRQMGLPATLTITEDKTGATLRINDVDLSFPLTANADRSLTRSFVRGGILMRVEITQVPNGSEVHLSVEAKKGRSTSTTKGIFWRQRPKIIMDAISRAMGL